MQPLYGFGLSRQFLVLAATLICLGSGGAPAFAQSAKPTPPKADAKAAPAEKVALLYKAQSGQIRRARAAATLAFTDPTGNKHVFDIKETGKTTFTGVNASGDITFEDVTEASETVFDGRKEPADEKKETNTSVIHPNGVLVSYKNSDSDKAKEKFSARLYNAATPIFPAKPVGVGDKWSFDFKSDDTLGTRNGHADYEIVSAEKVGDVSGLKINFTYQESGDHGIAAKGYFIVEKSSGDKLSEEYKVENVPLGDEDDKVYASGTASSVRVEGGPLSGSKNAAPPDKKEEPKKDKTIEEVVKDYEKIPGFLTLYRKRETGRDTIYAEVREDQLGKLLMLQTTASTGNGDELIAGDPISDIIFKLTKLQDDRVVITIPNWYFRADPKTPLGRAVKRSFPEGYLQSFKIEGRQADRKSLLIDMSDFFRGDFAQISQALNGGGVGGGGIPGLSPGAMYSLDREKTYITTIKNFPENLVIYTQYHFLRGGRASATALADPRSLPLTVTYNLFALPNDAETYKPTNGFIPRAADPRIGYFLTEYVNLEDDNKADQTIRYIQRWDLRKKDPSAALSEPVKPITFWLDNAIPVDYRDAVKRGVLMWNKAFEKIGFKNALEVKQMPDDADWDHADMRYNIVRWVVTPDDSPRHPSVGITLFRSNPLTGQVLGSAISVDSDLIRSTKLDRRNLIDPAGSFARGAGAASDENIEAIESALKAAKRATGDPRYCAIGEEMRENAWLGDFALDVLIPGTEAAKREKEYTEQLVVEVVAHEMGHVLGLRHNFIASTQFSLEQLKDPVLVREHGIGASVMDYNNFNISAVKTKGVDFYSQTVGDYDNWAIEYGYRPFANAEDEKYRLKEIASLNNRPGHAFQSDIEAAASIDPRVTQFDLTSEPLTYWEKMLQLNRYLMLNLDKREPKVGESYWEFTRRLNFLIGMYSRSAGVISRYIGGVSLDRNHRGDPQERPTAAPIDFARQKKALALMNAYVFAPTALSLPESYYTRLTTDPFDDNSLNTFLTLRQGIPIADQVSGLQRSALRLLFSTTVLQRVANNEYKRNGDPTRTLTQAELFSTVGANVWAELGQKKNIPTLRRQLQRTHLDAMINLAVNNSAAPEDSRMLAGETLRQLKTAMAVAKAQSGLDAYTRIHLTDTLAKIDRALDARLTISSAPSGGGNLLQMLLGGKK